MQQLLIKLGRLIVGMSVNPQSNHQKYIICVHYALGMTGLAAILLIKRPSIIKKNAASVTVGVPFRLSTVFQ